MDISQEYIQMCRKAEEIQEAWQPADWDYAYCPISKGVWVLSGYETDSGYYGHEVRSDPFTGKRISIVGCSSALHKRYRGHIFIPRQDQLFAMMTGSWYDVLDRFIQFCSPRLLTVSDRKRDIETHRTLQPDPTSIEDVCLRFIMASKYGKVWDGKEWVKK